VASIRKRALIAMSSACDRRTSSLVDMSLYSRRALEYWRLDRQYRDRSRFLAAASLVSYVLGLVERYAFFVVGRAGVRLLSHIGASLNRLNLQLVDRLLAGGAPIDLDQRWVRLEQSAVQHILHARQADHPDRFAASMRGIDRLLAFAAWRLPIGSSQALLVGDVVRTVARTHGGRLQFANQRHREHIGIGLIARIRG
jgi:hypothetical protein